MKIKKALLGATIILFLSVVVCYLYYHIYYTPKNSSIKASGTIEATAVEINARSSGIIQTLDLEEGNTVNQGQLLAQLSRNDLVAQKERDAASVVAAEAHLADLQSGAREQEIAEAAANVDIARANYEKACRDYSRSQLLAQAGAISSTSLDQAHTDQALKKSQLDAAEANLNLLKAGNSADQVEVAAAEVDKTKAVLKATEAMLDDLNIYSPLTGTVLNRNYEVGEYVQAGASLASIANLNRLWLKVYIATDALPAIKLGKTVHFTVSGDNSQYTGIIKYIASQGEYTPKTIQTPKERTNVVFAVKIAIDNHGGKLKPGMPADVVIDRR